MQAKDDQQAAMRRRMMRMRAAAAAAAADGQLTSFRPEMPGAEDQETPQPRKGLGKGVGGKLGGKALGKGPLAENAGSLPKGSPSPVQTRKSAPIPVGAAGLGL